MSASYFDMAGPMEDIGFVASYQRLFADWHDKFKAKGLTAFIGCGSAPGLANIIARGGIKEAGAFLVRVEGTRDDKPIQIDSYVNAPGLVESFEKSGLSHEAYLTGQCAAVFVKMMVEDVFTEKGLYVPEQLKADACEYCFRELADLDVTVDALMESPVA